MKLHRILEKLTVFAIRDVLTLVSPTKCTRFLLWYYRRRGMRIVGTPKWIAPRTWFDGTDYSLIELNEGCTISANVRVLTHDWALYTVARGIGLKVERPIGRLQPIRVGRHAFVGMGSLLLPGTDIGDCALVGACTVVRGRVPPYAIYAGNPGQQVGDVREYICRSLRRLGEMELLEQAEEVLRQRTQPSEPRTFPETTTPSLGGDEK